ncbi:MAG: phosphatidylglycerol lysyltransferase domain-containing protein [Actinomycetota bacterium]|nr:phosphatidylglycerol lysyltransferase domain-containing protein [Actinomycetota bacterium]
MAASQTERRQPLRWRAQSRRVPNILAALTALFGLLTLVSALAPAQRDRVHELSMLIPAPASATATAIAATAGVLLLQLARGLARRKRRAWRAAVAVLGLLAALHILKGLDVEEAALSLALLIVLVGARAEFQAKGDPTTRMLALEAGLVLPLVGVVSGMVLVTLYNERLVGDPSHWQEFKHVVLGLVGIRGPLRFTGERVSEIVAGTLLAFGLLTAFVVTYLILRPPEPRAVLTGSDERRLRELLASHGCRDSLGYFALRRDKSVVWSPSGKAAICYRVVAGVALASGDPLGDPEAWPGAIEQFLRMAREHAWTPAVVACGEAAGVAWQRVGLDALEMGDEAVVEVGDFTLQGRAMRNVRQMVGRVERAGYVAQVRRLRDLPRTEIEQLRTAAAAWRGAQTERGFSMALGRFGDTLDGDCVVVTAHQDGALRALLNFVPWGADGLSLDLMRRDRTAEPGLNEFLIVRVVESAPALGVKRVSLNFAVFRSALERGERLGAGPVTRLWSRLLVFASRWWQIETLYRFNVKFRPIWEPRYVCFPTTRDVPRVAVAALEAEAYLNRPRPFQRLCRRSPF